MTDYRGISMRMWLLAALTPLLASSAFSQNSPQWRWVSSLQRQYQPGGNLVDGDGSTYEEGTVGEEIVSFSWSAPVGPKYLIYEISGTLHEPTYTWDGTPFVGDARPSQFNFNGAFGDAWGRIFPGNFNYPLGYFGANYAETSTYDVATGAFYYGRMVYAPAGWVWSSNDRYVAAKFLLESFDGVAYLSRGSVTVSVARVGISNDPYVLGAIPGPTSILPFGIALLSQGRRRSRV